jgi:hypothetical protein
MRFLIDLFLKIACKGFMFSWEFLKLSSMKYVFFGSLIFFLFACSDVNKGNQLATISALNKTLDSIQVVLEKNEIDTIAALGAATNAVELRIKNNYYADTIDMELGKKMDAYKVMRRTIEPLSRSFNMLKSALEEEKVVLSNLQSDIDNGNGNRKEFSNYVTFESNKVNQMRKLLKEYVDQKVKTMKTFHALHDELDAFSMELVRKNAAKLVKQ